MKKKSSLSQALMEVSGRPAAPIAHANIASRQEATVPSRVGKKVISGFFDPAVSRQLKEIGLDKNASIQALLTEALNDLFEKYGRSRIA